MEEYIVDTEQKESETTAKKKEKNKKEISAQPPKQEYTAKEYASKAEELFSTKYECVMAAFSLAGVEKATLDEAKDIVKAFLEMEV